MPISKNRKAEEAETVESTHSKDEKDSEEAKIAESAHGQDEKDSEEAEIVVSPHGRDEKDSDYNWPKCWTLLQKNDFCPTNNWLYVKNKMFGCKLCSDVENLAVDKRMGMKISVELANGKISYFGEYWKQQLM
ncbi:hypothetical protein L9F63_006628 [Diploptera punctata]|uniref:Uncharacterized protein n=1 Tax=Diploptera punctata TaxID=6984 RepID=A0AAD7ZAJ8_DIPPU|nr:hypothetical protein L9F63_006628 [Diploptera punctata]